MVALLHRGDARADIDDDASTLMAENRWEKAFRISARKGEVVGVTDPGGLDLDQHFARARAFQLNGHDLERLSSLNGDGGANIHGFSP